MASTNGSSAPDIPALLRFLTQDAKLPLAKAMATVKSLQSASLASPSSIATAKLDRLDPIFDSTDDAKRVFNAAKRVAKRATSAPGSTTISPATARGRKRKFSPTDDNPTPQELEDSLAIPEPVFDVEKLRRTVLYTNRAPLLLAFAVVLLKFTMPKQPLSSRLSLAQGMVSTGAREKAVNIGLEKGKSAEEEGYGVGQPVVRVMSRDIRVMKRWGYEVGGEGEDKGSTQTGSDAGATAEDRDAKRENSEAANEISKQEPEQALFALDLEALKVSNAPSATNHTANGHGGQGVGLPIYTPQSARSYLCKSFASAPQGEGGGTATSGGKPNKGKKQAEEKEENLGLLLGALELLYASWAGTLGKDDLNRRGWSWYVSVRPFVENGVRGWGGKGQVKLADILDLKKS